MDDIQDFETSTNVAAPTEAQATPSAGEGDTALSKAAPADPPEAAASDDTEPKTRDKRGRYRSRSSQATTEDVPRIQALTKQLRAAEAKAKELEAKAQTPPPAPAMPAAPAPVAVAAPPAMPQPPAAPAPTFPLFADWLAQDGNGEKTYEDYVDARADWRYEVRRSSERAQEAAEAAQKTRTEQIAAHQTRVTAAKAKYADWDTVVSAHVPITQTIHDAILGSSKSAEVQYFLGSHPDVLAELVQDSQTFHPSAVGPMRRYLDSLIPDSPPARNAAASTGSALALVPTVPKPPNPVRTGAMKSGDELPGDDSSLEEHERVWGRKRRRRG